MAAEKAFFKASKKHFDPDGFGPIPSWDEGVDEFSASTPDGTKFTRYEIVRNNVLADAQVIKAPKAGATGKVALKVRWNYALFGKVDYKVRFFCGDGAARPVTIVVGSEAWDQRALDLIKQKVPFRLRLQGAEALTIFNHLQPRSIENIRALYEGDAAEREPIVVSRELGTVAVLAGALTLIALAGFATLAFVIKTAIDAGLCVKAKHSVSGPSPIDDQLELDVHDCSA